MQVTVSEKTFARVQYSIVALILLGSTFMYLLRDLTGYKHVFGLGPWFDVGGEGNLPTYFSALNFLLGSLLLAFMARLKVGLSADHVRYWRVLAWGFLYLSFDEATQIHENFGKLYEIAGEPFAVFESHHWLPVGIVLAIAAVGFFVPFLLKLPRKLAIKMGAAGAIFLTGAIGFEFLGALMFHTGFAVRGDLIYELRRIAEEGCEMFGIAYFNVVLVRELTGNQLKVVIGAPAATESAGS